MTLTNLTTSERATLRFAVLMTSENGLIKTLDKTTTFLTEQGYTITRVEDTSLLAETEREIKREEIN